MPHNNTVKALNSHNEVVIGYLADSKIISIVEGSGKRNTEILPNTVRRYICSTTSGTPLYVDDIIFADGIHKGIIKFGKQLDKLGYNQICYYIKWLSSDSNCEADEINYLRTDLGYWLDKKISVIGNAICKSENC